MKIVFDPVKNARNIEERQLSFERAASFDFASALYRVDARHSDIRHDYGETRYSALGKLDGRAPVLVFVETADGIRVISFRKANPREVKLYDDSTA